MLEENVNLDLQHVCCWLQANKLSINAVKCKYMIIESQYNLSHMNYIPDINILGHKIERVFYIDQLGVTIDDQLFKNGINMWANYVKNYHQPCFL